MPGFTGFNNEGRVPEFSPWYYGVCTLGGMFSAGTTHLVSTPLDVLKVNMQGSLPFGENKALPSLWRGWSGKFCGYGVQGGCKFGLYGYFKRLYSDVLVDYNRTSIFFLSSASAQIFADVALCPFESVKVRVQTQPHFAKGLSDGFPKVYTTEGLAGFYRGLWGRNLPCNVTIHCFQ
ncbi:hypothetical protein Patl1_35620 [Pistacia atlantica]|nr:hypothetical protein Patl1_35620 [Pistacia atlantica]